MDNSNYLLFFRPGKYTVDIDIGPERIIDIDIDIDIDTNPNPTHADAECGWRIRAGLFPFPGAFDPYGPPDPPQTGKPGIQDEPLGPPSWSI